MLDRAPSAVKYTRHTTALLARRDQVKVPSFDTGMAAREMKSSSERDVHGVTRPPGPNSGRESIRHELCEAGALRYAGFCISES